MLSRIKRDDIVVVLSGKDKGKTGSVISVDMKKNIALVKGVSIAIKHVKARKANEKSKIVKEETPIKLCKVMPICPACKKSCRVRVRFEGPNKRRACHRCDEAF